MAVCIYVSELVVLLYGRNLLKSIWRYQTAEQLQTCRLYRHNPISYRPVGASGPQQPRKLVRPTQE
jgi:hypothetical protein